MDWDDLRYILAVCDHGSALAAAQKLGVNASTVQRRITRFERQHDVRLFERLQTGYLPTPECEAIVEPAREIDGNIARIGREMLGHDVRLEGRLAVTTTDTFITRRFMSHVAMFQNMHPNITLELTLTNSRLNLSRQDADIAIRPSIKPQDNLVGQRVADLHFGIYASSKIAASVPDNPTLSELHQSRWLRAGEALSGSPSHKWMLENVPTVHHGISIDTYRAMATCARETDCLAILPCIVGDEPNGLERLNCDWFNLFTHIWVLTHPEIKNAARIRAFLDHMTKAMRNDRKIYAGNEGE